MSLPNRPQKKDIRKDGIRKNKVLLVLSVLLKFKKRKKRTAIVMLIKSYATTVTKKATMQTFAPSQKTSIDVNNFYTNDY